MKQAGRPISRAASTTFCTSLQTLKTSRQPQVGSSRKQQQQEAGGPCKGSCCTLPSLHRPAAGHMAPHVIVLVTFQAPSAFPSQVDCAFQEASTAACLAVALLHVICVTAASATTAASPPA